MRLSDLISETVAQAFMTHGHDASHGRVNLSDRPDLSQYQCSGAFHACKVARASPRSIADAVVKTLSENPMFARVTADGGGFINLSVSDEVLARQAAAICSDPRAGWEPVAEPRNVVIDFGGPNVAKAMHVGHLRSTIIGDCLQRLFRLAGHRVTTDIHLGDWGTQMGMLITEVKREHPELPYFDVNSTGPYPGEPPVTLVQLGEMYPRASGRCKASEEDMAEARAATAELQAGRPGYRALWRHFVNVSRKGLEEDFAPLKVSFDLWYGESTVHDRIPLLVADLEKKGLAVESEGALVVRLRTPELPPLMLRKSDGAAIYSVTDLATVDQRVRDLGAQVILYVVDNRQSLHFQQVFEAAEITGIAGGATMEHIKFGTVNGEDGKPFKTRSGGVLSLRDLTAMAIEAAMARLDEAGLAKDLTEEERRELAAKVGLAAVKYADLQHIRTSDYMFSLDKFTRFEGNTGPYLQYAAVRVKSILRKAAERGFEPGALIPPSSEPERDLMLTLCRFPEAVGKAHESRMPHFLCDYVYELSRQLSRFYESCHILREADPARRDSWLALVSLSLRLTEMTLALLGIEIPDRM